VDKTEQIIQLENTLMNIQRHGMRHLHNSGRDLPESLHQVLNILMEHFKCCDDPISMSAVATKMNVTLSAVSQSVDVLERKKIVQRARSETDKRIVNIELTKRGRTMMKAFAKHHRGDFVSGLVEFLGDKDSAELSRIMKRVSEYMNTKERGVEK
jgi:DNA-binding MarR family transcriptional regulator